MSDNTDVAALTAGVVAVAVTMFVAPGAYDITGVAVSITLLCVVAGYVAYGERTRRQSLAVAAVIGLLSLPVVGFVLETCIRLLIADTDADQSVVPSGILFAVWIAITITVAKLDHARPLLRKKIEISFEKVLDHLIGTTPPVEKQDSRDFVDPE